MATEFLNAVRVRLSVSVFFGGLASSYVRHIDRSKSKNFQNRSENLCVRLLKSFEIRIFEKILKKKITVV